VLIDHLSSIHTAEGDEKNDLTKRLHEALVMLATGAASKGGGSKGMRDARHNILFVPNPHDQYYDDGCNWVIYPIMSVKEMKEWAGEKYDVAIFSGEKIDDVPEGAVEGHWIDGKSKHSAEAAEMAILSGVENNIRVCSTSDLRTIATGMRVLGPAIADWHTCAPSETEYKFNTGDLSAAIEEAVANQRKTKTMRTHDEVDEGLAEIKAGIELLGKDLKKNGILVPGLPTKNSFGLEGKHVFKTEIKQTHVPDPIVLAA
jgi:hypothetical protein